MSTGIAAADPLASHRWEKRPLVLIAPEGDPRAAEQERSIEASRAAFEDRDQVLVAAREGDGLRQRFGVAPGDFAVVLVGLDGGEKARWSEPVDPAETFALIDAMPMRLREMREDGQ